MLNIDTISWLKMAAMGYLLTISFETPVLFACLGKRYSAREKLRAGVMLTALSYPFVLFVFPLLWNPYENYPVYISVSEVFAPAFECLCFALLFQRSKTLTGKQRILDYTAIVLANLFSFLSGEIMKWAGFHFA